MSSDNTPTEPNPLAQILAKIQNINDNLLKIEDRLSAMEGQLLTVGNRLSVVEDRLLPTNQLPQVLLAVNDLNRKFDAFTKETFREFQRRQSYDEQKIVELESRIDRIEEKLNDLGSKKN